jgi:RNA polymerase sigma-70 factor (ECF subfamily)
MLSPWQQARRSRRPDEVPDEEVAPGMQPRPLDAERPLAGVRAGRPTPRPRPTPFPRRSAELLPGTPEPPDPVAVPEVADPEPGTAPEEPTGDQVPVWQLVERAQQGDGEAFGELYDRYVTMVHRYVVHRVGDRALAEDVTSETFVRALRRIDSLSFQGRDVGAWLVTIARNIVLDHVKSSRYRLEVSTADMLDADRATDGPEDAVVAHLTNTQLLACVKQLGGEQQECIVLRFLHGLSVAETAAVMGKKDGAIKALQHRAVRRLAALLPDGFP